MQINERSFLRKTFRFWGIYSGGVVLLVAFQNCQGPAGCGSSQCLSTNSPSSSSTSSSNANTLSAASVSSSGRVLGGSGSSSGGSGSSSSSVVLGGSGGSGGRSSASVVIGGGGSSSGSNGSSSSGGGSVASTGYRITVQPKSQEVNFNDYANLSISVAGGVAPYSYQWFKDDQLLVPSSLGPGQLCNTSYSCGISADRYSKEGLYRVEVKDARGNTLKSQTARVSIVEPHLGCPAGSYAIHGGAPNKYTDVGIFNELFENPRGKFLVVTGDPSVSGFMFNPNMFGFTIVGGMPRADYGQKINFVNFCRQNIPKINTGSPNPGCSGRSLLFCYGDAQYQDGHGYKMSGGVTMECYNNKWRLVENTCNWSSDPSTADPATE